MNESGDQRAEGLGAMEVFLLIVLAVLAVRPPSAHGEWAWIPDILLVLVAFLATARRAHAPGLASPYVLLAVLVLAVSHLRASDSHASWAVLAGWARLGLAFTTGASLVTRPGVLRRLHLAMAGLVLLATAHALLQLRVLYPRLLEHAEDFPEGFLPLTRATSVFILPAHLGAFCAMAGVLALALVLYYWRMGERGLMTAAIAVTLVALWGMRLAASMGGLLCFSTGLASLVLLGLKGRARFVVLLLGAVTVLLLVGASYHQRQDEIRQEGPGSARAANWRAAMRLIREEPISGHGGGGFLLNYPRVKEPGDNDVRHAHQIFLHAAAEHGVFALPLLLALAASSLSRAWLAAERTRGQRDGPLHAGLLGAGVALVTFAFVDFGWVDPTWGVPAALILGACHGSLLPRERRGGGRLLPSALAVCALGVILLSASIPHSSAERVRLEAHALAAEGNHEGAGQLLARALAITPGDTSLMADGIASALARALRSSSLEERSVHVETGLALAERAVTASPRRALLHSLRARCLLAAGQRQEAIDAATRAVELAPQVGHYREDLSDIRASPAQEPEK